MKRVWMQWPDNDLFSMALYKGKLWYVSIYWVTSRLYLFRALNPMAPSREERDILEMTDWDHEHGNNPEWADVKEYEEWNREFQEKLNSLVEIQEQ